MNKINITKSKQGNYYIEFCSKTNQFLTIKVLLDRSDMENLLAKIQAKI
jgi:hypothetical protein